MRARLFLIALVATLAALAAACSSGETAAPPVDSINDLQIELDSTGRGDSQLLRMTPTSNSSAQLTSTYEILDYEDSKPARVINATVNEARSVGAVSDGIATIERSFTLLSQSVDIPQSLADEVAPEAGDFIDLQTRTYNLDDRGISTLQSAATGAEREAEADQPRVDVGPDAVPPTTDQTGESSPVSIEPTTTTTTTEPADEKTTNGASELDAMMSQLWLGGPLPNGEVSVGAIWRREGRVRLSADDIALVKQRWEIVDITAEGIIVDGFADVDVSLRFLVPDRFSSRKVTNGSARAILTSDFRGLIGFDGLSIDAIENRSYQTSLVYQDRTYRLRNVATIETSPN